MNLYKFQFNTTEIQDKTTQLTPPPPPSARQALQNFKNLLFLTEKEHDVFEKSFIKPFFIFNNIAGGECEMNQRKCGNMSHSYFRIFYSQFIKVI